MSHYPAQMPILPKEFRHSNAHLPEQNVADSGRLCSKKNEYFERRCLPAAVECSHLAKPRTATTAATQQLLMAPILEAELSQLLFQTSIRTKNNCSAMTTTTIFFFFFSLEAV